MLLIVYIRSYISLAHLTKRHIYTRFKKAHASVHACIHVIAAAVENNNARASSRGSALAVPSYEIPTLGSARGWRENQARQGPVACLATVRNDNTGGAHGREAGRVCGTCITCAGLCAPTTHPCAAPRMSRADVWLARRGYLCVP